MQIYADICRCTRLEVVILAPMHGLIIMELSTIHMHSMQVYTEGCPSEQLLVSILAIM